MKASTLLKTSAAAVLSLSLAACAGSYRPIVDGAGQDMSRYETDLMDCQAYADQVSLAGDSAAGTLTGGVVGALVGLVGGSHGHDIARGAGVGAVTGLAGSAMSNQSSKKQVIRNCMSGRGYRVLG